MSPAELSLLAPWIGAHGLLVGFIVVMNILRRITGQ